MRRKFFYVGITFILLASLATSSRAQDRLCDTAFEDCRAPLWALIDGETVGIDIAFWFMQDTSIANKIVARHQAGVPIRILVDPRANPSNAGNEQILNQLKAAGIPMRFKNGGGILHWKMMLFVGQNRLQFSGANYGPAFFVPTSPNANYIDEAIYFTSDQSLINSFKTKYDNIWTDTINYSNYGNITGSLQRKYPTFAINSELNFPPSPDGTEDYYNRTALNMNSEAQKIDIIMYRITNQRFTDTTIAAIQRGVLVRLIHEPNEYRNPARQWDSWNIDRMHMAGVQIKMRKHLGLNHQKSVLLYGRGMTIFGSSNWTGPSSNSQEEHNYFTTKSFFFQWFVNQFERKWNATAENVPFVPLDPAIPVNEFPANGATAQVTPITLRWEGGPWSHKYDIFFGTSSNPPLLVADASTAQSGATSGQPLLDSGSVDDGHVESYTIRTTLQPGTTYFWRVVGKTMANKTANGPTWSFTTSGSTPNPTPTPTPTPTPGAESPNNTRVPPGTQIVDSAGAVWTLSGQIVLRDGVDTGGRGTPLLYCTRLVYVFGLDNRWWRWNGSWAPVGTVDPCSASTPTPTPTPTPPSQESANNTRVPPATQIVDSSGAVWTRNSSGVIFRNGVDNGGRGSQILYCNRIVYVFGTDSQWWRWTGAGYTPIGTVDPCGAGPTPTPTPTPTPLPSGNVVLWAAEAPVRVGAWSVVADGTAAGGKRISNPDAGAAKLTAPLANPANYFEMTFNATAGVDYRLWIRGRALNDFWGNDSVFIQFSDSVNSSGAAVFRIGSTSATEMNLEDCSGCGLSGWGWQDNGWGVGVLGPLIRFATSGTHTIRIQVREDGLSIDQIVLSPQTFKNSAPGSLKNDTTILPQQ